ncbi:MAG: hypothetical protein HKN14_07710 [Marinicaulis sp.]|nr:hypothetical protein [Marinicaulis sp.]NNL87609.1 hypothetical protein [Marinicaulis sp.]
MNCILNHCHEHIAVDFAIIAYYAIAVGATIVFALLSQSKTIKTAALIISGVWLVSILYFLAVGGSKYFLLVALTDSVLAFLFWRMAKTELFPAALCCFMIANIVVVIVSAAIPLSEFWTIFTLNRIFELMLAYIIGSSIYRIRKLRPPDFEEAEAMDRSLKFLAG